MFNSILVFQFKYFRIIESMELLLKSGQHIAGLVEAIKLHEQNIALWLKRNSDVSMNEFKEMDPLLAVPKPFIDTDVPMKDIGRKERPYVECTYGSIYNPQHKYCLMTHIGFKQEDTVILVRECNHIFGKEPFLHWMRQYNHCPQCKRTLF